MRERRSLEVQREIRPGPAVAIFRLSGKMTGTQDCYEFLDDVRDQIRAGQRTLILNLERVEKMSSPGVGILAACYTSVTNAGGRMALVGVPDPIGTLLKLVCLYDLLPRYATEDEALSAAAGTV